MIRSIAVARLLSAHARATLGAYPLAEAGAVSSGTRDTMVIVARVRTLAKATRATVHETAVVDAELATLDADPWVVEARAMLEARYAALEAAEEQLHLCAAHISDTLGLAQAPPRRPSGSASASAGALGTQPGASGTCGSSSLTRSPSLSRILAEQSLPRLSSPFSLVPAHGVAPDTRAAQQPPVPSPRPAAPGAPLQEVPSAPRPAWPTPWAPQEQGAGLYTPVALPAKPCPPMPAVVMQAAAKPKPPPPVLGQTGVVVAPLARATAAPTTFRMPGVATRYGKATAGTPPPKRLRRQAQHWGTTSAAALRRDGPPCFFEDGFPAGWKLVMGDLPRDTDATQARRTRHERRL